jgi:hypothetical protein
MVSYERREVTTRVVEFIVPAEHPYGACWVELYKAVSAAHQELVAAGRIKEGADAPDDMIRLLPGDADIVVQYQMDSNAVMVKPGTEAA